MDMRVSVKGQIVIPAELRRKYGIEPGISIRIVDTGNGILLKPITDKRINELRGILKGTGLLNDLLEERAKDAERENRKFNSL